MLNDICLKLGEAKNPLLVETLRFLNEAVSNYQSPDELTADGYAYDEFIDCVKDGIELVTKECAVMPEVQNVPGAADFLASLVDKIHDIYPETNADQDREGLSLS